MSCNAPAQPHCPPGWHSHCGHSLEAANKESHLLGASQPAPAGLKAGPEHCFSLHMKHLSPLTFLPPLSTDLFGKQTARKNKIRKKTKALPPRQNVMMQIAGSSSPALHLHVGACERFFFLQTTSSFALTLEGKERRQASGVGEDRIK